MAAISPSAVAVHPPAGTTPAALTAPGPLLLRVPNWVGDAVLALPAVAALHEACPDRAVLVAARRSVAPLFARLVTDVLLLPDRGLGRLTALRDVPGGRPAAAVVFPDSGSSAAEVAVARPRTAWGYAGGAGRAAALDVRLPARWGRGRHRWEKYALLAAAFTGRPVPERYPVLAGPGDVAAADALFAEAGIAPGARAVGLVPGAHASARRWPAERFAELAAALGADGIRVVLLGSAGDAPITAAITGRATPAPADWAGRTTLPVLAECCRRLALVVTNDTGPMHLAAAVGAPLVDLCGAADERVTGPRGPRSEVLVHPIHCRPCVKNVCAYNLGCMTGIPVAAVLARARARLGVAGGPGAVA